jgi:hypothetical protein
MMGNGWDAAWGYVVLLQQKFGMVMISGLASLTWR